MINDQSDRVVPGLGDVAPWIRAVPGVILAAGLGYIALWLPSVPYLEKFSALILAILLGMGVRLIVGLPSIAVPGLARVQRPAMQLGIILLGFKLTLVQVGLLGFAGVGLVVVSLAATFFFTVWLGARLGVEPRLARLIAAGCSVCGASAVMAANRAVRGRDEDVAYAVACVTLFGTISMIVLPALAPFLALDARSLGLWTGAAVHEVGQVLAAAFQGGPVAGEFGTVTKMSRVVLLLPVVLFLLREGRVAGGPEVAAAAVPVPWFVFLFGAMILVNSVGVVPAPLIAGLVSASNFLLSLALAALGLGTDIRRIRAQGLRPLVLAAGASLFIALLSLALILI